MGLLSMGLLGDFLASFYGCGPTFESIQAHLRYAQTPIAKGEPSRRAQLDEWRFGQRS